MTRSLKVSGSLPEVIRNTSALYEGNLTYYARVVFHHAQNLEHPYHNFRHMFHVLWLCHEACRFHHAELTPRAMRNLLIAALFHDFNHSGMFGDDDLNIERAVRCLKKHIAAVDVPYFEEIVLLIRGTQYPYVIDSKELDLCGKILRDADVSQAFTVAWIQQVIFGLAREWNKTPVEILKMQEPFFRSLSFQTVWAREQFPMVDIEAKIRETREMLELLEEMPM